VRLEAPQPPAGASLTLETIDWTEGNPLPIGDDVAGQIAELSKETNPPFVALRRPRTSRSFLALVRGLAGQPYTLQHLSTARRASLEAQPARRWVGTVHAGYAADALDATGVLFAVGNQPKVLAAQTIELSPTLGYRRRFNLFEAAELFLHVGERTSLDLAAEGLAAQFRIEPLLYTLPANYRAPASRSAPTSWTLDPGYYVLTLTPTEGGVLDLSLSPKGTGAAALQANGSVRGAVNLGEVNLQSGTSYVLWTANQGGVESGLISRTLPLDLSEPLSLSLRVGEERLLRFRAAERGTLTVLDDQGGTFAISRQDGGASTDDGRASFEAGEQTVKIRNSGPETRYATVAFEVASRAAVGPLPTVSAETLAALPSFDRLREGAPIHFELAQGATRTFLVEAAEPGLYSVETQGLLAIAGALRTRVEPSLLTAEQNGVGRNVALRTYLREGDYQLTVRALGLSAGEATVALSRARLRDGGELAPTVADHVTLAAGDAVAHRIRLRQSTRVHLDALRLGGRFDVRVEDLQGWPVAAPWMPGDVDLELPAGEYRSILAPRALEARALVRFAPVVERRPLVGHGPHRLTLDLGVEAEWNEPAAPGSSLRQPDHYTFDLPAAATVEVELTDEMHGHLWGNGAPPIELPPGRTARLPLARGSYEMAVVCSRRDSKHRYQVRVSPLEWVDGIDRALVAPVEIALSVGTEGTVELSSYGDADVRARLFDQAGSPVGSADDRADGWNFLLSRRLEPGRYRLRVDPVGTSSASTRLALKVLRERSEAPLAGGGTREVELADEIVLLPIAGLADAEVFAAALAPSGSGARFDLSLERRIGSNWTTLASSSGERPWVALPLDAASRQGELRLRLGSVDHRPAKARVLGFAGSASRSREGDLPRGVKLAALGQLPIAASAVTLDRPGCFSRGEGPLWQSRRAGEAAKRGAATLASADSTLWLFAEGRATTATARRVRLGAETFRLSLAAGERVVCDLAPADPRQGPTALRVVEASSLAGQPLVVVPAGDRRDRGSAVGPRRALAVAAPGADRVELSNSSPPSSTPIEVVVSARSLEASRVARTALPPGPKRLHIGLAPGSWAIVGSLGSAEATLASFGEASEIALDATATEVHVFSPEPSGARLESFAVPARREPAPAFADGRFEERTDRSGRLRRDFPSGPTGRLLQIRGGRATFVSANGQVVRSSPAGSLALGAEAGTLEIEHRPGFVLAWLDGAAPAEFGPPASISPPAALSLGAPRQAFGFDVAGPTMLVVRSAGPAAVSVTSAAGQRFEAFVDRTAFAAPVAAGRVTVGLAGLAGEPLVGTAELTLEPLGELREGLTPAFLLPSGGTRAFAFTLAERSDVGFGVASEARGTGEFDTVLFDAQGREVSRGAVQRHSLDAGRWVLAVRSAASAPATTVRLGIVGLERPSDDPPSEEVQRFLALAANASGSGDGRGVQGSESRSDPFWEPGSEADDEYEECSDCDERWDESAEEEGEGR
jgi:hypothetical protein